MPFADADGAMLRHSSPLNPTAPQAQKHPEDELDRIFCNSTGLQRLPHSPEAPAVTSNPPPLCIAPKLQPTRYCPAASPSPGTCEPCSQDLSQNHACAVTGYRQPMKCFMQSSSDSWPPHEVPMLPQHPFPPTPLLSLRTDVLCAPHQHAATDTTLPWRCCPLLPPH